MAANQQSFDDLEKQLAKDALEQALKDLHGVINKEIENNKESFSKEIQKTLASFKQALEKNVSEEIDKKLSSLFETHFHSINQGVKTSFEKAFDPVLRTQKMI
jgi:F0F1-type ATP synthase membrane subunit b/b'